MKHNFSRAAHVPEPGRQELPHDRIITAVLALAGRFASPPFHTLNTGITSPLREFQIAALTPIDDLEQTFDRTRRLNFREGQALRRLQDY